MEVLGTPVDLASIEVETYVTGATTDHLTPWRGCYRTTQLLGGESTFVLSNAGHIASLINPPGNPKAHFFAGPEPGAGRRRVARGRRAAAGHVVGALGRRGPSSARARSAARPRRLGSRRHPVIEPAPGAYVRDLEPVPA